MATPLSYSKDLALVFATRTSSTLSVVGSIFIITTFVFFPYFRKPINRLVFLATFGNILTNTATLISIAVLPEGASPSSSLCQAQGIVIQWFMVADSFWVFCMSTNVFLVFFYGYDAQQIRHLEKWYFAFSYGIPALPAILYVILENTGHPVIGSATLWCWVATDVEWMRIAFFYAPAWIFITATLTIYVVTGYRIWRRRVELRSISRNSRQAAATIQTPNIVPDNDMLPLSDANNIIVTTQITQDTNSITSFSSTRMLAEANTVQDTTICISKALPEDIEGQRTVNCGRNERSVYRATIVAIDTSAESTEGPNTLSTSFPEIKRTTEGNAAAMAYFQVAFLMFLALFVVWLPSSINRMFQFVHRDPSFSLNISSAIVLPLQGAWNAVIYISTTRKECKRAWGMTLSRLTGKPLRCQPQRNETMTSSQETRDSTAEIALDEILKEGSHLRYSEAYSTDGVEGARCHRNLGSV
ncbi:G protein coupled receptor family protein [Pyrenophora tritici-repentis]|uniref:G protein coupled receptor family protein n=1 Tax=Pyrenophora tritici-repentis TaxID=45151 RepID=A0A316ZSX1_9PLEO|nr:G protein coupled receptor family protein [Pyrenophora tritici-repentis]